MRRYGASFLARHGGRLTPTHRKALASMAACRTAAMGGRRWQCDECGARRIVYNSCRDRHCPGCQGAERASWLDRQRRQLLPVEYFHLVFTVPHELTPIAAAHLRTFYTLLLRAVRETLQQVAADPKHLGATIGGLMVLHTWGQNLALHPHVHVIVPGGGLNGDGFVRCPRGFFLPVKVLSRVFRGKLLALLRAARDAGELPVTEGLTVWNDDRAWNRFLTGLYAAKWVVYSKRPAAGPDVVLKYLARYTHRVAISNRRIERISDGRVTFRYKDYAHRGRTRRMTLPADEFLRRFAQHVLPKGFVRIRSFGILAPRGRNERLAHCRQLLAAADLEQASEAAKFLPDASDDARCPHCGRGRWREIGESPRPTVAALVDRTYQTAWNAWNDTS